MDQHTSNTSDPLMIGTREAAHLLNVSPRTLYEWTVPRGDIPVLRTGRTVRYSVEDLRRWVKEHMTLPGTTTSIQAATNPLSSRAEGIK